MYYRVCETLSDYGKYVPYTQDVQKAVKNNKKDYYRSIYLYNDEQVKAANEIVEVVNKDTGETYERPRGVAGVTDVKTKELVWDLDNKDLEVAKADTIELINRLIEKGFSEESIGIFLSGGKGFHVHIFVDQFLSPSQFKLITSSLADGLTSFDSVVANPSRVIRMPYTRHQKTGLFKTRLEREDLDLDTSELQRIAKDEYQPVELEGASLPPSLLALSETPSEKPVKASLSVPNTKDRYNPRDNPLGLSEWKSALLQGFFPPGQRSNALMILAATLKGKGFDADSCYYLLRSTINKQAERYDQEAFSKQEFYQNVVTQVYGDFWTGGTYAEDNFPQEIQDFLEDLGVSRTGAVTDLQDVDDVYAVFEDYAENIDKNTIHSGIPGLDDLVRMTTSMLVGVLACPAAGKTATVLNILNNMSLSGESSVFFSMDMGKPLVYQKMAQKLLGYESDYVFEIFAGIRDEYGKMVEMPDEEKKKKIRDKINENYSNVKISFDTACDVDKMREYVLQYQQKTGKKVRLIAVDYLEKIPGPYSDATANSGFVAKKLQALANDLDVCVMVLLQPQKLAGDPRDPILTYRRIKGASLLEQDCRVVISLWREGYDPQSYENDHYISYAVLKNTMGGLGQVDCAWNGLRGEVTELDDAGKAALEELRKANRAKKAAEMI